jgi:hypothetical protein
MIFAAGFRRRRIMAIGRAIGQGLAKIGNIRAHSGKMIMNGTLRRSLDTGVQLTIDRGK